MRFSHFNEGRPVKGHTVNSIVHMELEIFQWLRPKGTANKKGRSSKPHGQAKGRLYA